jgi:hypothetical protein
MMGYTLIIGEACLEGDKEDAYLRVWAKGEAHDEAPTFPNDAMTGKGNSRSPSYTGWANFCRDVGLYGMFYGMDGRRGPYMKPDPNSHREVPILSDHPGFAVLNERDALAVRHALDQHIASHGELEPGFRPWAEKDEDAPANALACAQRARLIWLDYWVSWAVKNCQWPVVANL